MKYGKWCPNGCGKCVINMFLNWKEKKRYKCDRCKQIFTLVQLKELNNIKGKKHER